jgi:MYND finger
MGKKSKKKPPKTWTRQNTNSTAAASSISTSAGVAAATAAVEEEVMEPIAEFDLGIWEARFPFVEKTSDPGAQPLDKAQELFLKGIQLAKSDLCLARLHIASAFLRDPPVLILQEGDDERALNFDMMNAMIATRGKSLQATSRRGEIYGPRAKPDDAICTARKLMQLAYRDPQGADAKARKESDRIDHCEKDVAVDKSKRNCCINCKKHEGQKGVKPAKCSRCKRVYFCSKECIRAVSTIYISNDE